MNAIRIITDANSRRSGTLVNTQYEEALQNNDLIPQEDELVYKLFRRNVHLSNIESLTDGDYEIGLFQKEYLAASIVEPGHPLPVRESIDYYRYIADEESDEF